LFGWHSCSAPTLIDFGRINEIRGNATKMAKLANIAKKQRRDFWDLNFFQVSRIPRTNTAKVRTSMAKTSRKIVYDVRIRR
ncbi:unnamed protein product, partial [Ectocarpus sp. 12 AP-2014]